MQSVIRNDKIDGVGTPSILTNKSQAMQSGVFETEQDMIIHAQKGDQKAFKELVQQHLPNVLALGFRMLGNSTEAEDMAQDVMLGLWQNVRKYDPEKAKFSTWLYRITANRCLDRLRKKTPDQLPEDYDPAIEAEQVETIYNKQLTKLMDVALKTLPERQYLALVLFHYQGHKMTEVAEIMECSSEAVESLLARARRTLKQKLGPLWQEFKDNNSPHELKEKEGEIR